jgi:hypothetical protein
VSPKLKKIVVEKNNIDVLNQKTLCFIIFTGKGYKSICLKRNNEKIMQTIFEGINMFEGK